MYSLHLKMEMSNYYIHNYTGLNSFIQSTCYAPFIFQGLWWPSPESLLDENNQDHFLQNNF